MHLSNHRRPTPNCLATVFSSVVFDFIFVFGFLANTVVLGLGGCKHETTGKHSSKDPRPAVAKSSPAGIPDGKHDEPVTRGDVLTEKKEPPAPQRGAPAPRDADPHVTCTATLKKVDPDYPWFENHGTSHSDGRAPLATFTITKPQKYAGRRVSILFKYKKPQKIPGKKNVGQTFFFKIAPDFFTGKASILDNTCVHGLKQIKP